MKILVIPKLLHQIDQIVTELIPLEMQLIALRHFSEIDKIFIKGTGLFYIKRILEITSYELYLLGVQEVANVSVLEHVLRPLHQVQGVVPPELGLANERRVLGHVISIDQ